MLELMATTFSIERSWHITIKSALETTTYPLK